MTSTTTHNSFKGKPGILFIVFFLLLLTPLQAKAGTWTSVGPKGARIRALAISPNYVSDQTIFAGTLSSGVYKSTNRGGSWTAVNTGLSDINMQSLVISPTYVSDQTIFAGTSSGGVFKSTNRGGSWSAVNTGLSNFNVQSLVITPNYATDQTIFAGTYGGGVFKSTNGGGSWSAVNTGLNNLSVQSLAVSPGYATDLTLFAGTSWGGYKSTDGGGNWSEVAGLSTLSVQSFAISPGYATDQTIFAGIDFGGVYKSTNGGGSWSAVNTGLSNLEVRSFAISPGYATDQTIYAGIDGGGGVYKSTNQGGSWSAVNSGLSSANGAWVRALAISPGYTSDQTIFAGTNVGGVFRSTNRGGSWSAVNTGLNNLDVTSLAISPSYTSDQTIFAAIVYGGVHKSINGGGSWSIVNSGLNSNDVGALAISPNYATDKTLFAATFWDGDVYKSTNGGGSWSMLTTEFYSGGSALSISPNYATDQTIFAGVVYDGVYKSTNSGGSWSAVNTGLNSLISALSISPNYATDQTIFAGSYWYGVYKSTNGGGSWSAVNTGLSNIYVQSLVISPNYATDQTIFAGTWGGGVYKSTDGGGSWSAVNTGLSATDVISLSISPNYVTDHTIYAGTYGGGVFKSASGGESWSSVNTGLGGLYVSSFAISPAYQSDRVLFAGTEGYSVWKYAADVCSPVAEVCNGIDDDCDDLIDDGVQNTYYQDSDTDAYGSASVTTQGCIQPSGYVTNNTDCNDSDASINPDAAEACNGIDDDCDGLIDDGVQNTYYQDSDTDAYGSASVTTQGCIQPSGYVTNNTDCNDSDASVNPGAAEACNGVDDNCNTQVDEEYNQDGDGYATCAGDCDDNNASINPGAPEVCNGVDDNCNGLADNDYFYFDADGDGYGDPANVIQASACSLPNGYVSNNTDCNDGDISIYPGATEIPNDRIDQDCSGGDLSVALRVDGSSSGDQRFPWVDYNETTGEFLVLWQDKRNGANDDIYGVRLDVNGSRIGSDFAVTTAAGHQQRVLVKTGGGGYLALWHDLRNQAANGADIYGAWIDGAGNVGQEMAICACQSDQWNPVAGYDPVSNTFLVTWLDARGSGSNQTGSPNDSFDLYGVVIPAGGSQTLTPFPVIATTNGQRGPQIGYDYDNGRYYLAWNDRRNGTDYNIYGTRLTTSGVSLDGTGVLLSGAAGNQFRPTVTDRRPAAGVYLHTIAWTDYRYGSEGDVVGIYVDGNGSIYWSEFGIDMNSVDKANVVADIDWINTRKSIVGYIDKTPGTYFNINTATVGNGGGVQTWNGPVAGAAGDQRAEVVTYATDGVNDYGFLVVWMDKRNGTDYDIYGIKVWP